MGSALEKVQEFFDSLPDKAEAFGEKIANKLVPGVDAFTEKVLKASDKVNEFGDKLAEKISNHMPAVVGWLDRKSTRLNSSHLLISYAVFCLKKKNKPCLMN